MKIKLITQEDVHLYEYVLEVETGKEIEIRKLYEGEGLIKRWELSLYNNRNVREEKEFNKDNLSSLRYFDRRGRIVEEHLYSEGLFSKKILYFYNENQRLYQTKTFDDKGTLLYSENYEFNSQGMIRRVKRTWSDGQTQVSSFIYGKGRLIEEVYSSETEMTISRFDDTGRLKEMEIWKDNKPAGNITYFYNSERGYLEVKIDKNLIEGIETDSRYNEKEYLITETVTKAETKISESTYVYDDEGRKVKMKKVSDRGLEEWTFYYDSEGDLNREEYYNRGLLERRVFYTGDNSYYEELFREGKLLIRVYYEDETKVKEEFINNGEVIKVKVLENQ